MSATVTPRLLTAADLAPAQRMSAAFGWPHRHPDWAMFHAIGEGVALDEDGVLIGTGMWWAHGPGHATIGMVLVAPDRQGRGHGKRIMAALLAAAAGRSVALIATTAGLPLYAALGFTANGEIHQYQGAWTGTSAAKPAPADPADIIALDAAAFGAPRPRAINALLAAGTVVHGTGGFAIRRSFGRGSVIGPVVAPDEASSIALITALAEPGSFTRLDIPAGATALAAFLSAHGLTRVDAVTAMTRGPWPASNGPHRFALIAQALG